MYLFLLIFY